MIKRRFFLIILLSTASHIATASTEWQSLQPGLDYTNISPIANKPSSKIHAFRIDLHRYQLQLAFADTPRGSSAKKLALKNNALVAINGGFFTPDKQPIGLRINDGQQFYPIQPTSWWGVFYLKNETPYISSQSAFRPQKTVHLAVQSGPRLLVNGHIPKLKPGLAERSAICITKDNDIILAATERLLVDTYDFAELIRKPETQDGLNCYQALNLDGGNSTQLYSRIDDFRLSITGLSAITDAIIVTEKH